MPEYGQRDAMSLEPHYSRHVSAMTTEHLRAKSDIAAELAFRDKRIAELEMLARDVIAAELTLCTTHDIFDSNDLLGTALRALAAALGKEG